MTNEESFYALNSWHEQVVNNADSKVVVMVLGNKVDMPNKKITTEQGRDWASDKGFGFMEVSAKTGLNVSSCFEALISTMYR